MSMLIASWMGVAILFAFVSVLLITIGAHAWWHVPYVPTPVTVARKMTEMAKFTGKELVYDLGAGDGRVLMEAKRLHPGIRAIGYEIALGVWLLAKVRGILTRSKVEIRMQNFLTKYLGDADVIFLYLSPSIMARLIPKFEKELKPGTRIVSHTFRLPNKEPKALEYVEVPFWGRQKVFLYIW
jgi:hypothetical protein